MIIQTLSEHDGDSLVTKDKSVSIGVPRVRSGFQKKS